MGRGGEVCIYVHTCIYMCVYVGVCARVCERRCVYFFNLKKAYTIGLPIKASHILRGLHVNMEASVRVDGVIRTSSSFNWSQTGVCAGTLPA